MLFDYLNDHYCMDIEENEKKMVHSLIDGSDTNMLPSEEHWIYQIVANKKNSIDVDKFDYICRDSYHIGQCKAAVDLDRIFNSSRLIDGNLCFHIKVILINYRMISISAHYFKIDISYSNKSILIKQL
jgi:HD superfamily phosphohydrolase